MYIAHSIFHWVNYNLIHFYEFPTNINPSALPKPSQLGLGIWIKVVYQYRSLTSVLRVRVFICTYRHRMVKGKGIWTSELLFSSPELKAQVSFSDHLSSVVCLSVRLSVNFSHFHLLLQNHWGKFNQTWHKASLGEGDSSLFKWRAPPFSKGR